MTTTTPDAALAAALAAFQKDVPKVAKTQTANVPTKGGGGYRYTYAGLPDVTAAVMPKLAEHGLSFAVCPRVDGDGAVVVGILLHAAGGRLEASLPLYGRTSQELGSSLTYARRYLLGAMTGVVTDDDDDGNTAEGAPRASRDEPAAERPRTTRSRPRDADAPAARRGQPGDPATEAQRLAIADEFKKQGITDKDTALRTIAALLDGLVVDSTAELTAGQADLVLDALRTDGAPR